MRSVAAHKLQVAGFGTGRWGFIAAHTQNVELFALKWGVWEVLTKMQALREPGKSGLELIVVINQLLVNSYSLDCRLAWNYQSWLNCGMTCISEFPLTSAAVIAMSTFDLSYKRFMYSDSDLTRDFI